MTFWIIFIAAILIGLVWWQARANQNNGLDMTNNKNNVQYHQTHLATEASEELTPEIPSGTNHENKVYYHQTHLAPESSQELTSENLSSTKNNMVQQNQNQTSQALTLYDPSSVNNNKTNDGVSYHQTHLALQPAQTDAPAGGIQASEEGIQQVQQQVQASYQQNQEQNK